MAGQCVPLPAKVWLPHSCHPAFSPANVTMADRWVFFATLANVAAA